MTNNEIRGIFRQIPWNMKSYEIIPPGIPWNKHPQTLVACARSIHFRIPYKTVCYYSISVYAYIHKL